MLTKQEREATIERIKSYGDSDLPFYKLLFGSRAPYAMQYTEYLKALKDRIIDLCDTSNMLELPVDKDGEVIRVGDTVYDCECTKYEVAGHSSSSNVLLSAGRELICFKKPANELTHKEPVTVKLLAQRIKRVLGDEASSIGVVPHIELRRIAKQLESLGDSDEA
jgi:hypothetical protein|nr:MAG TPA: hypothetical protein [Caudoviricetes sp.]